MRRKRSAAVAAAVARQTSNARRVVNGRRRRRSKRDLSVGRKKTKNNAIYYVRDVINGLLRPPDRRRLYLRGSAFVRVNRRRIFTRRK